MVRPTRNIDQQLIEAGRALLAETGCRGFSIRELTDAAGVNLGMFHYHFKTRDNFLAVVLQNVYEEMFASLTFQAHADRAHLENLRAAVNVLGRFSRDNRLLLRRLMADMMAGEAIAQQFFRNNVPRHLGVMAGLIADAQRADELPPMAIFQAMSFIAGAVAMPIMMATALQHEGFAPPPLMANLDNDVLSDVAIAQRVDMALYGLQLATKRPAYD
ncbi:MAG: TetR/AcrR family transcriptional regulator [Burkholderiales bacterium]